VESTVKVLSYLSYLSYLSRDVSRPGLFEGDSQSSSVGTGHGYRTSRDTHSTVVILLLVE
jgi:hypothetical protein